MHIPPELERLASLNENDLRREAERLRGSMAMTVYKGTFIGKNGLQKKDESDDEEKKKKVMILIFGILGLYFAYNYVL